MSEFTSLSFSQFINHQKFPCIMAKASASKGFVEQHLFSENNEVSIAPILLQTMEKFTARVKTETTLSSFVVSFDHPSFLKFEQFEAFFWRLLETLDVLDKRIHSSDSRVSDDPDSPHFSFSINGEAFFILLLHPESPRLSRQFSTPTLVFNAHRQFEELRQKGVYQKVRDLIRARDMSLQGSINPMVADHGERSEIFQYTGKQYSSDAKCPFHRAIGFLKNFGPKKAA